MQPEFAFREVRPTSLNLTVCARHQARMPRLSRTVRLRQAVDNWPGIIAGQQESPRSCESCLELLEDLREVQARRRRQLIVGVHL